MDEVIEPEEVTAASEAWRPIGEEVTEQLDYQPARFFRRRIIRKKNVKRDEPQKAPIIALLNTLQERSIAAPGCSRRSSSPSTAIICRSTGRSRFLRYTAKHGTLAGMGSRLAATDL